MQIVVASQSLKKLAAVGGAAHDLRIDATILGIDCPSGVNAQPVGDETQQGAANRIAYARMCLPKADYYVGIENGIFAAEGGFYDKAIVMSICSHGTCHTQESEPVLFPADMVECARVRGFQSTTVGMVMQDKGLVKDHADPHKDLIGKSRTEILRETVRALFESLGINSTARMSRPAPTCNL